MEKRTIDIAIISDIHLGSFECHAQELLNYLKSIKPKTLILNGDFIDIGKFDKKFFPKEHIMIIDEVLDMALNGTKVFYITGNRDDVLRKFSDFSTGTISLRDKLVLLLKNERYWIFHGDVFDSSLKISPRIAKLGGKGYDLLLRINRIINRLRKRMGKSKMSFSRRIKSSVKRAVKFVQNFERTAINLAAEQDYDFVICGHIHQPVIKEIPVGDKKITYMNSGDWVENLTALEYNVGRWSIYKYDELDYQFINPRLYVKSKKEKPLSNKVLKRKRTETLFKKIMDSTEFKQRQ